MEKEYIDQFKKEYNDLLLRHWKAFVYLEDNNVPLNQRKQWLPEYEKILNRLNVILNTLEQYGVTFGTDEALGGFDVA